VAVVLEIMVVAAVLVDLEQERLHFLVLSVLRLLLVLVEWRVRIHQDLEERDT
jgi:hypothetical protein|tara:strand:+ start:1166 stop:1324 length:159 start_codon:yes stop_codon:yes gene_type:complete